MENLIISEIFKKITFTNEEEIYIKSKFLKRNFNKSNTLLRAGDPVDYQYFVVSGCFRTYYIQNSGKEHNIQFAIKGSWISDYAAFFNDSVAVMNVGCIKAGCAYRISQEDMEELCQNITKLRTFFRKRIEKSFSLFQKRIVENLSMSAKERYDSFIATYPKIEQMVTNYHIASYLGVTTETLSRIRKKDDIK
jgi:CRP-like cAMP-binding protein